VDRLPPQCGPSGPYRAGRPGLPKPRVRIDRRREPEPGDALPLPADVLTPREREVARLVAQGLSKRQVAEQLVLTEKTAANHVGRVFEKLGVHSRGRLALRATELGVVVG
jgi:DNA-binding NarL/FixJ family response regulator